MCWNRILLVWGLVVLFCAPSVWAQCSAVTSDGTAVANRVSKFTTGCNIEPSAITETGGKVGIGTSTPAATLDVKGTATIRGTVQLPSTGTATATKGFNSQPLDALASAFNSSTDKAVSQHFRWQAEPVSNDTASPSGSLNLLYGSGTGTPTETGFSIMSSGNTTMLGVTSFATSDTAAISASAMGTSGHTKGIYAETHSPDGDGARFVNWAGGNILTLGGSSGTDVVSFDGSGNVSIGGNLSVGGAITASTKDFMIDDPLDPDNKYMYHAAVESSEVMNMYTGNATTDAAGNAVVQLPAWFEVLNRDFRYQLTVIGQFAQAMVASKIQASRFTIKTDKPNVEVSWQVTGVRQDSYAKAHPLVVEQEKPAAERGYYLHPELFGQPESKGITYAHRLPVRDKQLESAKAERAGD